MKLQIRQLSAPLSAPFATAAGELTECELVLVGLESSSGETGWGEAATLEVPSSQLVAAIEDCRDVLSDAEQTDHEDVLGACSRLAVLPEALAAIDLALWDLAGRTVREPVWRLLGCAPPAPVRLNATVAARDRAGAAAAAARAAGEGFRCLKVKVGLGDDAGRLAAVRAAAGPDVELRIDANGVWSSEQALASLRALAPVGLELCEEPVHGLDAIEALAQATDVPLSIDETTREPGALSRRACTAVCLKVARCGGITATIEAARTARAAGYEVYLASMLDGPLGIAAALHCAAVIEPDRACGLATLGLFAGRPDPLTPREGAIAAPAGPGLGDGLANWY